ncbi:rRNA maturation RNase YbeY [Vannielia sp.]|uniref:rRNA maturation RNase YbeY n=1 Tax=Vannielia sp. TaxID=2813045 RepID=UPI002604459F|nr:rRNA maturation RNase YbeY [Vannielia sp.]MDF1872127.1 rRNA maturation RNase YbeY [Vannielia sp.]
MDLDVVLEDDRWKAIGLEVLSQRAVAAVLAHQRIADGAELAILAADDARIATLNEAHRGKAQPTNVLSWPAQELQPEAAGGEPFAAEADPDGSIPLGDIALAYETCAREAEEGGIPFGDHLTHLIVHGTMHLLGYDHINDADAELMEAREAEVLAKLGLANPYEA